MPQPKITVVGSINMDLVIRCHRLPRPGETVKADSVSEVCGGKGANQAVAVARAGGSATMIGRVGDDSFASRLRGNLMDEGIDESLVESTPQTASGLAAVHVESSGQNMIVVVPGANDKLSVDDVEAAAEIISQSDLLLLQLEVPLETVLAAKRIARRAKVRVIVDPAPASNDLPEELLDADLLCPNETEVSMITDLPVEDATQAAIAAEQLIARGSRNVAITLGDAGVLWHDGKQTHHCQAYPINPVDSTAAGDAFAGALAVRWAAGNRLSDAVLFASAAGAIAASRRGAQPSIGREAEIVALQNKSSG